MTRVLVIDDNREVIDMLASILSANNCCVRTARSGSAALQLLKLEPYDVVITDILMPDHDGFEVIMEINGMQPRPRVIAMTGGTQKLSREYLAGVARIMNVEQVFYKPFDVSELLEAVLAPAVAAEIVRSVVPSSPRRAGNVPDCFQSCNNLMLQEKSVEK